MNTSKRKTLVTFLLIICILLTLPFEGISVYAADTSAGTSKEKNTVTVSGITYKITSKKNKTAAVTGSDKTIKNAIISSTVKIGSKSYKVTSVAKNAFKKRKQLVSVELGANIKTIGASAFEGSSKLNRIEFVSKRVTKIDKKAFSGIDKKAVFYITKSKYNTYKELLVKKNVGWKKTMKVKTLSQRQVTLSNITYKIINSKKKYAAVVSASKSIKTGEIPATVRINGKKYKVTAIEKDAFAGCKNLRSISIGANITTIGDSAFKDSAKLKEVIVYSKKIKSFADNAFAYTEHTIDIYVYDKVINTYFSLLYWSEANIKLQSLEEKIKFDKVKTYTYSVIPFTNDVCSCFYVKTDNPDPFSFFFRDEKTTMKTSGTTDIRATKKVFADVKYVDKATLRVKGGYIFINSYTDGGTWRLYTDKGGGSFISDDLIDPTDITVKVPKLVSSTDYLIDKYTTDDMSFWDKMYAVQKGLYEVSVYTGCAVFGGLIKDETRPYYGLMTSPHIDQSFYIWAPYSRSSTQPMLLNELHPYKLDSLGFPAQLSEVAQKLSSDATVAKNPDAHYVINITYNGETKLFGGAGHNGGQYIYEDQIKYFFSFDGSKSDAFTKHKLSEISEMINYYGTLEVPIEKPDGALTWEDVRNTVGDDGAYVKLRLILSINGKGGEGYTYLYNNPDFNSLGYFSNAWYDGRYFNRYEFFELGTTFEDEAASKANIVIKDVKIKFPESSEGKDYRYNCLEISEVDNYDSETEIWKGFTTFVYNETTDTWLASIYTASGRWETGVGYFPIEDEDFIDACTLTREEVEAMNIDKNANTNPKVYYNYNIYEAPGGKVVEE